MCTTLSLCQIHGRAIYNSFLFRREWTFMACLSSYREKSASLHLFSSSSCWHVPPSENCCATWLDPHSFLQGDKDPVWRLSFKSAPWLSADTLVVEPQATDKERRKAFFSLQPQPVSFPPMACLLCWLGQDKTLLGYINAATMPRGGELTSVERRITSPQWGDSGGGEMSTK